MVIEQLQNSGGTIRQVKDRIQWEKYKDLMRQLHNEWVYQIQWEQYKDLMRQLHGGSSTELKGCEA